MADKTIPHINDRQSYRDYSGAVREERVLLDQKTNLDNEIKWLDQAISLLTLNSTNPTTDPTLQATTSYTKEKQKERTDIVSRFYSIMFLIQAPGS